MHQGDILRYGAWTGVVATAEANRRHYGMATTWLPHLVTNTVALLLPDVARLLFAPRAGRRRGGRGAGAGAVLRLGADTLRALVRDNPAYVSYVLPLAAGYILSHPSFTIYKGRPAELRLAGFGLDAIPHGATAFALTAMVGDALQVAADLAGDELRPLLEAARRNEVAVTALALAAATLFWEVSEHRIHQHELGLKGSVEAINMQWSPEDTLYDCAANAIGWAAATLWRRSRGGAPAVDAAQGAAAARA